MEQRPDAALVVQAIDSRADFVAAVRDAVVLAGERGVRRMLWVDADFAQWPLDDAGLLQALTDWLRQPQRQLVLLAGSYDEIARRRPRFAAWYRLWAHAVSAHAPAPGDETELPCVLLVEGTLVVQMHDPVRWRGRRDADPAQTKLWADRIDAILQRCEPAFPATTLGL